MNINRVVVFLLALFIGVASLNVHVLTAQFDELPTSPIRLNQSASWGDVSYSITQSSPDNGGWFHNPGVGFEAQHSATCGGPPQTHSVISYDDSVYICAGHVMTALDGGSAQGTLALTPNKMLDWTNGPATFAFEMSTSIMADRDWIDIVVVPFEWQHGGWIETDNMPKVGFQLLGPFWQLRYFNNHVQTNNFGDNGVHFQRAVIAGTNQAAQRQKFVLTVTRTHIKMEMLPHASNVCATQPNLCVFFDADVPDTQTTLGMTKGLVQIGQHSYNPTKGGSQAGTGPEGVPASWHWDNFVHTCNPGPCQTVQFIRANKTRFPLAESGATVVTDEVTFDQAAGAGAYMRFNASGHVVNVSFNGGTTWQAARHTQLTNPGAFMASYFHPVPQGTRTVKFYLQMNWNHTPVAADFELWSLSAGQVPTATPTAPNTVVPATFTPTRTPTTLPTQGPTNTPFPTLTATATVTATVPPTATIQPTVAPTAVPCYDAVIVGDGLPMVFARGAIRTCP